MKLQEQEREGETTKLRAKLSTTIDNISSILNLENTAIEREYHTVMKRDDAGQRHQNNNLKATIAFANFLD
jgi:hypothetical protein